MKKILVAVVASLLAVSVYAAQIGGGVSGLRVHNHSAASLGGSTLSGVTCSGCTLTGTTTIPGTASGLVLIQRQSVSSGTNIDFAVSSSYDANLFVVTRCYTGAAGEYLVVQVSTDGGGSYLAGANYDFESVAYTAAAATAKSAANTSAIQLQPDIAISNNVAHGGWNGTIELHNHGSSAAWKWLNYRASFLAGAGPTAHTVFGSGTFKSTTAVTNVRFRFAAGSAIAACSIAQYGWKQS